MPYLSIDGLPLQLAKKDHSNQEERQQLLTEALKRYELKGKILLADRDGAARAV